MIIKLNLQLFAQGEKTEKPTPKKRREAREEGQILQSKEINSVVILFSCFFSLKIFGGMISSQIEKLLIDSFNIIPNVDVFFYENNLLINFMKIGYVIALTIMPILVAAFLSALIVNYLQVGFIFTTKPLKLKLDRLNPIEGFKRMFSKRALVDLVKSILKLVLVGYIAYMYLQNKMVDIVKLSQMSANSAYRIFANMTFNFVLRLLAVLLGLSALDYFFKWQEHEKKLKMSKQEIKEEYKQSEGDPLIKGKIKEKQRSIAMSRMMQDVPKADVIITNPTHYAVAVVYDNESYEAPYIIAKGADLVAQNIKKVAKENSLPIVENKYVARTIYETVEIGDIIPEDLYEAVAEILAYVYNLKNSD